jgi:plasmid stabilization system protein ParE
MAYEVIFSDEIFEKLNSIIYYLENNWSKDVAEAFLKTFYRRIDNLAYNPKSGMQTKKNPAIRRFMITKHNTLYYEIFENRIELLTIFFNSQNPDKNNFE